VAGSPQLPFAVVPHTFDPLAPDPKYRMEAGYRSSDELRFLMRDFSCDSDDGESPVRGGYRMGGKGCARLKRGGARIPGGGKRCIRKVRIRVRVQVGA
jgi:hypothetical protein